MEGYFKELTLWLASGSEAAALDIADARIVMLEPSGKITLLKHDARRASQD